LQALPRRALWARQIQARALRQEMTAHLTKKRWLPELLQRAQQMVQAPKLRERQQQLQEAPPEPWAWPRLALSALRQQSPASLPQQEQPEASPQPDLPAVWQQSPEIEGAAQFVEPVVAAERSYAERAWLHPQELHEESLVMESLASES
jgi:hypothetical protein